MGYMWVTGGVLLRLLFFPAPPTPPLQQKVYTLCSTTRVRNGKVLCINSRIKIKVMSLFYDPWTIIPFIIVVVSYLLRAIPPFSWIWFLFKWLCIGMLIGFTVDKVKKDTKEWWNKD